VLVDGCRLELDRKSGDVKNQCTGAPLRATSIEFLCTPGLRPFSIVVNEDGELVIDLNKFVATPSCGS
jgi:hypothetical protein